MRSSRPRDLGRALLDLDAIVGVRFDEENVHIETHDPEGLYARLEALVLDEGLPVGALSAEDASLDAIFKYLVA